MPPTSFKSTVKQLSSVFYCSDVTELHVHHAERQQLHSGQNLLRCHDGALQEEHMVGHISTLVLSHCSLLKSKYVCDCVAGMMPKQLMSLQQPASQR